MSLLIPVTLKEPILPQLILIDRSNGSSHQGKEEAMMCRLDDLKMVVTVEPILPLLLHRKTTLHQPGQETLAVVLPLIPHPEALEVALQAPQVVTPAVDVVNLSVSIK